MGRESVSYAAHTEHLLTRAVLTIGPYSITPALILAPMAGVTDLPFRRLCRRLGAGMAVSEMVTSDTGLWQSRKSRTRLRHDDEPGPISVQIAGSEPDQMAAAARANVALGAEIIDINMGCPAKKVCRKAAGSALLADPTHVSRILHAVVAAVDVPVTLKIRTGTSPEHRNGVAIARIAEQAGIQALAVHGRTRACRFNGNAEFDTVRDICQAVQIPVLANGDITSGAGARRVLQHTGAEGLLIGRGAQGNPWVFREIAHYLDTGRSLPRPSLEEQQAVMMAHLTDLHAFYGAPQGVRIARKHIGWYLQAQPSDISEQTRREFNRLDTPAEQLHLLDQYFTRCFHRPGDPVGAFTISQQEDEKAA